MNADSLSFARMIRAMEVEEVKSLNYDKMLAFAVFETRNILADMRRAEVVEVMESLPEGGTRKRAKHRIQSRALNFARLDAGHISKPGIAPWRGEHDGRRIAQAKRRQKLAALKGERISQAQAQARQQKNAERQAIADARVSIHVDANTH